MYVCLKLLFKENSSKTYVGYGVMDVTWCLRYMPRPDLQVYEGDTTSLFGLVCPSQSWICEKLYLSQISMFTGIQGNKPFSVVGGFQLLTKSFPSIFFFASAFRNSFSWLTSPRGSTSIVILGYWMFLEPNQQPHSFTLPPSLLAVPSLRSVSWTGLMNHHEPIYNSSNCFLYGAACFFP